MNIPALALKHKVVVAIVVIVVALLVVATYSGDFPQGAPKSEYTVSLKEVGTDNSYIGGGDIEPPPLIDPPDAMTAYNVNVQAGGINMNGFYRIEFQVKCTFVEQPGVEVIGNLRAKVSITGQTTNPPPTDPTMLYYAHWVAGTNHAVTTVESQQENIAMGTQYTFDLDEAHGADFDCLYSDPAGGGMAGPFQILGSCIDGSTFHITVEVRDVSTNGLTYYGIVTADVILIVDQDGNVNVNLDDVTCSLGEET